MAIKFGGKNPWPECNALLGSKDMHWSAKVNQRSNSLEMPCVHRVLVERTPDQSVMHWWGQRSCKGQLGSARGRIASKCVRPSNNANAAEHYAATGALVENKNCRHLVCYQCVVDHTAWKARLRCTIINPRVHKHIQKIFIRNTRKLQFSSVFYFVWSPQRAPPSYSTKPTWAWWDDHVTGRKAGQKRRDRKPKFLPNKAILKLTQIWMVVA